MTLKSDDPTAHEALFQRAASALGIVKANGSPQRPRSTFSIDHVTEAAQPFVAALLARHWLKASANLWIVCRTEREQERFFGELSTWIPNALLFPPPRSRCRRGRHP